MFTTLTFCSIAMESQNSEKNVAPSTIGKPSSQCCILIRKKSHQIHLQRFKKQSRRFLDPDTNNCDQAWRAIAEQFPVLAGELALTSYCITDWLAGSQLTRRPHTRQLQRLTNRSCICNHHVTHYFEKICMMIFGCVTFRYDHTTKRHWGGG